MKRRTFLAGTAATALTTPAIAQTSKKLTFLSWNIVDQADLFKTWFAEFGKLHPGVEIEWLDKKGPDLPPFYQTQLAAGTPPDVVDLQGGIGVEYAAQGALLDLTPYLAKQPDVKARFNADYLGNWVWEGKNWLVPFYVAKSLLFYNKSLFKKAGIEAPATSFDELLTQAEKIGAGGGDQTGFLTLNFDWLYWALFRMNDVELLTPDLKQPAFDTPKMIETIERLAKGTAGTAINKISWTGRWVEPLGAFASGQVGMLNAHSSAYFFLKGQGAWINPDTLGVAELPGNWSVPTLHGYGISKGTKDPDLAWAFVEFCTAKKQAQEMADNRRILTGYTEVDDTLMDRIKGQEPLAYAVLKTQLEHTDKLCGNWPLPSDSRVKDAFYPELQNALLGRKDAKTAMKEASRKVARELRRA
ncbi:sugar ABC transporter substrate-binding protein [Acidisphaera sp. S103]|uniref:ABC transporter substrate-binding protein n=1 Tax=Acidisphaera sp. S103 TaxID=1747223 RepID=UPI00131C8F80|nr:sugar ABC transporter substrate-binding protein [Acidisphaera sp. S103]